MKSDYHTLDALLPSSFTGISKLFIQSCLEELKISNTVSENSLKEIYKYIKDILDGNSICKNYKNNYTIFKDNAENNTHISSKAETSLSDSSDNNININNNANTNLQINFFLDDFYFNKAQEDIFKNYRNNLLKIINGTLDKLTRKLDNINSKIEACQNMEKYKVYGELLIANIYRIDTLKTSDDFVELENYYDNNNLVKIPINNELSTSQNAENYFKKYNKQKNTLEIVNAQKKDSEKELDYLESLIYELDNANDLDSVNEIYNEISENILFNDNTNLKSNGKMQNKEVKKETSSIDNYMRMNIDGYTVLIGKNNRQNDYLTMKVANDNKEQASQMNTNSIKDNKVSIGAGKKILNTGKEFLNMGMYMAEGRNFDTSRNYNRNNINNTRREDYKKENNENTTIINEQEDDDV